MNSLPEELQAYTVKRSKRAKHVNFKLSIRDGLIITIPNRFNLKKLPPLIQQRSDWIEKHWQEFKQRPHYEALRSAPSILPKTIDLPAINKSFRVRYKTYCPSDESPESSLYLSPALSVEQVNDYLRKWLHQQAKLRLIPWLQEVSNECELPFNGATIRNQKTRWGSCSSSKNINLNQKLLFLPPEYVEYIMIHELCHTKQMNHSSRFWQLLSHYLPEAKELDRRLRQEGWQDYVPRWCD